MNNFWTPIWVKFQYNYLRMMPGASKFFLFFSNLFLTHLAGRFMYEIFVKKLFLVKMTGHKMLILTGHFVVVVYGTDQKIPI